MKLFRQRTVWLPTWQGWLLAFLVAAAAFAAAVMNIHSFLAVTHRVAGADIVAVESWVPEKVAREAATEFKEGHYGFLMIPDVQGRVEGNEPQKNSRADFAVRRMISYSVPKDRIIVCAATDAEQHRSFAMGSAVRDALRQRGIEARGVNVVAPAAHARKTWLAYSRALEPAIPVGIVAVLTDDYDPARWWRTSQGVKWVVANGAGWLHELIAGSQE